MLGSIISAGANLIGGWLGNRQREREQDQNIALQKEFAQHGIQWKVADAKAAGVHPLAALGAATHSYAPSTVGGSPLGSGIAAAGQDIGRAINATANTQERAVMAAAQLENMTLQNDLLRTQIIKNSATNPQMPVGTRWMIDGQGDSPSMGDVRVGMPGTLIKEKPMERSPGDPGQLYSEPGSVSDVGYSRTSSGGWAPVMSRDIQQRMEDDHIGLLMWNIRNRMLPMAGINFAPPNVPFEGDKDYWIYNPLKNQYEQVRRKDLYGPTLR